MFISIDDTKNLIRKYGLMVKDNSGASPFGYKFAIYNTRPSEFGGVVSDGSPLLQSQTVHMPDVVNKWGRKGAYVQMFNRADVEAVISKVQNAQ